MIPSTQISTVKESDQRSLVSSPKQSKSYQKISSALNCVINTLTVCDGKDPVLEKTLADLNTLNNRIEIAEQDEVLKNQNFEYSWKAASQAQLAALQKNKNVLDIFEPLVKELCNFKESCNATLNFDSIIKCLSSPLSNQSNDQEQVIEASYNPLETRLSRSVSDLSKLATIHASTLGNPFNKKGEIDSIFKNPIEDAQRANEAPAVDMFKDFVDEYFQKTKILENFLEQKYTFIENLTKSLFGIKISLIPANAQNELRESPKVKVNNSFKQSSTCQSLKNNYKKEMEAAFKAREEYRKRKEKLAKDNETLKMARTLYQTLVSQKQELEKKLEQKEAESGHTFEYPVQKSPLGVSFNDLNLL